MSAAEELDDRDVLGEQLRYYARMATTGRFDDAYARSATYDRGSTENARWHAELDELESAVTRFAARGRVLEMACGSGRWTGLLARSADQVVAVDAAPEMLALHRTRVSAPNVLRLQADLFEYDDPAGFDDIFFSLWLSHVPLARFAEFWDAVNRLLRPGGRVLFIDSLHNRQRCGVDETLGPASDEVTVRRVDGQEYRIVKVFHEPAVLARRLESLGWRAQVKTVGDYFYYGTAGR